MITIKIKKTILRKQLEEINRLQDVYIEVLEEESKQPRSYLWRRGNVSITTDKTRTRNLIY